MKPVLTLAAGWATFEQMVLSDAPSEVRFWLKRAYYAGAEEMFDTISQLPTETHTRRLAGELNRFKQAIKEGRA